MLKIVDTILVSQSANNSQVLCMVGAFTFGLGVGALAAQALAGLALILIIVGCVTHLTGSILSTRQQTEPPRAFSRWESIFYWSSWLALGFLLLAASLLSLTSR